MFVQATYAQPIPSMQQCPHGPPFNFKGIPAPHCPLAAFVFGPISRLSYTHSPTTESIQL